MTVREYRKALKKHLEDLKGFKPGTLMEFSKKFGLYGSELPSVDLEKMRYTEANDMTMYRAVDKQGHLAGSGSAFDSVMEYDSIDRLADMIAYYYHRSPFKLQVKRFRDDWSKPTEYERKIFENALDLAFHLDESR